jgi:hypothetical protein
MTPCNIVIAELYRSGPGMTMGRLDDKYRVHPRSGASDGVAVMNSSFYQVTFAIAFLAAACADSGTAVTEKEDMLAATGFVSKKADNPQRLATLKALPPHRFVTRTLNGRVTYLYGDPTLCGCVYIGDQTAYDRYRQKMAERQTATDEQIRAILSSSPLPGESGL